MARKLTLLIQNPETPLLSWYKEIFGPWIGDIVFDGKHEQVIDDCIVSETHLRQQDPAYFKRFSGKNAFLLISPDAFYAASVELFSNFCGVFRSSFSGAFKVDRVFQLPLGYNPGFEVPASEIPSSKRPLAWSFLGQVGKATRPECIRALLGIRPNLWLATDGWNSGGVTTSEQTANTFSTREYIEVLKDSAFCPCPMGNVSQETLRVYEALQTGSIPLLERTPVMDAHRLLLGEHPLPTFSNWDDACVFMEQLRESPTELDALQERCILWWLQYKRSLSAEVGSFVTRLEDNPATRFTSFVHPYSRLPGWRMFELARHHTTRALLRRLERHAVRLLDSGKFTIHD